MKHPENPVRFLGVAADWLTAVWPSLDDHKSIVSPMAVQRILLKAIALRRACPRNLDERKQHHRFLYRRRITLISWEV